MSSGDVFVRDPSSLADLNNTMEYVADSLLKIEESVDSYLEGVQEVLKKQQEMIKQKLEEAKEKLSEAEEALSSCEASQTKDEDGNYTPSCDSEQCAVEAARAEVQEWEEKYKKACDIVEEVKKEIDLYHQPSEATAPPGGQCYIKYLAGEHTDKATQGLRQCIENIEDYMSADANNGKELGERIANPHQKEDDLPLSEEEKAARFEEMSGYNIKKQGESPDKIADANRVMKCPSCGRPMALCICGNKRSDMVIINTK